MNEKAIELLAVGPDGEVNPDPLIEWHFRFSRRGNRWTRVSSKPVIESVCVLIAVQYDHSTGTGTRIVKSSFERRYIGSHPPSSFPFGPAV